MKISQGQENDELPIHVMPTIKNDHEIVISPLLPLINGATVFSGQTRSGKTNTMVDLLVLKDKMFGIFDYIFLWCPTYDPKGAWGNLGLPSNFIFKKYTDGSLSAVLKMIDTMVEVNPSLHFLLIFDDCLSENMMSASGNDVINELFTAGRHRNKTGWFGIQKFSRTNQTGRVNAMDFVIFPPANRIELKAIYSEVGDSMSFEGFQKLMLRVREQPYRFLHVRRNPQGGLTFTINWSIPVDQKEFS